MVDFTTMIMVGGRGERLFPLTRKTAKSAIRFGGMYRIIDFALSNCLNSGARTIYLLTQFASTSMERHIKHGWGLLFRPERGEFIETCPPQQITDNNWYSGTADSVCRNLHLIENDNSIGVLILSGDHIYKMDYRKMIEFHLDNDADMTISCIDVPINEADKFGVLTVDDSYRVNTFDEKPSDPTPIHRDGNSVICSMGVYFFSKKCLIDILGEDATDENSSHDFGNDIIPRLLMNNAKVMAYKFEDENKKNTKYWRDIGTIDSYYEASMDLVGVDPLFNLYDQAWPVLNFNSQLPPAKTVFNSTEENRTGMALDSLLSPGVIISGGQIFNSITSPHVMIHSWARVSNSILFDHVEVGRRVIIRNAIIDSGVKVPDDTRIGINREEDQEKYLVTEKGICVVTADTFL